MQRAFALLAIWYIHIESDSSSLQSMPISKGHLQVLSKGSNYVLIVAHVACGSRVYYPLSSEI